MGIYKQLTQEERYQIYALIKAGLSQTEMARTISRHKSTISRELRRNQGGRGYRPIQAHRRALERRCSKVTSRITRESWRRIDRLIKEDWSPEQISARLELEAGPKVSHEWIYQHIYENKRSGGNLHRHLRCQKKKRKRYGSYNRRGIIPNQVSIEERPAIVDSRRRFGDWECDTIIGKNHKGALVTLVERKSRFTVIETVANKTAPEVRRAIVHGLLPHKSRLHTLTCDNGREFAEHENIAWDLDADVYFAHPYASWERGLNENTNGLLRQYFPKKRRLTNVSSRETEWVEDRVNHRPRKALGFRTPYEVLYKIRTKLTVALPS